MTATDLLINSPDDTVQSKAFFKEPGMPNAYSGEQMITPLAAAINPRSLSTSAGVLSWFQGWVEM
jgi:hypothetical protein